MVCQENLQGTLARDRQASSPRPRGSTIVSGTYSTETESLSSLCGLHLTFLAQRRRLAQTPATKMLVTTAHSPSPPTYAFTLTTNGNTCKMGRESEVT